jgi:ABC-type phosphate transport system substrate-binding protein
MVRKTVVSFGFLLLLLSGPAGARSQELDFKVIVHPSNPIASMTSEQVSKLFLKKVTRWDHGVQVLPVDLAGSSPLRARFSQEIHGRPVSKVKAYWQQQIFSGREVLPPQKASDREVIAYVEANPGAIGYVGETTPLGNVRVIKIQSNNAP